MSIIELELSPGPAVFYDNDFRVIIETHLEWLRRHPATQLISVEADIMHKNQYDLYGLLSDLKVVKSNHWITMRMNDYTNPNQYDEGHDTLLIPDQGVVTTLTTSYLSTKKK